jgi:hypothetical protein
MVVAMYQAMTAEHVFDLGVALTTGFPVIAVAYYAARLLPDEFADMSDDSRRVLVPPAWAKGIRGWLVRLFARVPQDFRTSSAPWLPMHKYAQGADAGFLVGFLLGLLLGLASLTFERFCWVARPTCAISLVVFVLIATNLANFVTQTMAVRSTRRNEALGDEAADPSYVPFMSIVHTTVTARLTQISALAIAVAGVVL